MESGRAIPEVRIRRSCLAFTRPRSGPPLPFFAMDFVEGRTLAALLEEGKTDRKELLRILEDVARAVAQAMSKNLGQVFVVENKPGAGGTIGASQVAKSAPDGYTLLVNSSAHTVNPSIYQGLPYDTAKDLPAVSMLAQQPNIMVAAPSKGWKTSNDFVKAARQQPDKLNYASAGTGSGTHMNAEKFML